MSSAEYEDFVSEMHAHVYEQAPLFEIPLAVVDRLDTDDVRHGPWPPEACAAVLSRWHRAGLLGLYRYISTRRNGPDLSSSEVTDLLAHPERWVRSEDWTEVAALVVTDLGVATPWSEWQAHATRTR